MQTNYEFVTTNGWVPAGNDISAMRWVNFHVHPESNEGTCPPNEQRNACYYILCRLALAWELEWLLLYCRQRDIPVREDDLFYRGARILSGEDSNPQSAERFIEEMHELGQEFEQAKKADPDGYVKTWSENLFHSFNWDTEIFAGGKYDGEYWKKCSTVSKEFNDAISLCILQLYKEKAEPIVDQYKCAASERDSRIAIPWLNENLVGFYRLLLGAIASCRTYKIFPYLLPDGVECETDSRKCFDILRTDDQPQAIAKEIHAVFTNDVGERMKSFLWPTHQPTYLLPGYAE